MSDDRPVFYYDLNSPYAWLAAERIDSILPQPPVWQPISYAFVIRHTGRIPWPFRAERDKGIAEVERRAAERGLPRPRWPDGWPLETYSLATLRAVVVAGEAGRKREFSLAAFRRQFTAGRALSEPETVREAATECGLDPDVVRAGIGRESVKQQLKAATEAAIERGVAGIPTVRVGCDLFWGDDRLEDAMEAIAAGSDCGEEG